MHQANASAPAEDPSELIARVCRRDLRAFECLYRDYHPRLTRFLTSMIRRPQLVEEVLNDTMLVVWNQPERYNGASKLSTWIFAIAYRKALMALQRQDDPVDDGRAESRASAEAGPEDELGQRQVRKILLKAIGELSPDHRTVVDLTYFHEIGYREIAEIMDCPVDTVKTRMFHARRHLRRRLAGGLADWL
ncbi:RNA polymerase sigma factor [Phenylobacterium hankyongense]|uniref:RNA polymerase sigma factor n=1 Tax=Phenylobacterium hankyongense TaxID=1813876 RepID=A0A328B785_9CAUL|nr:RNA polymerase sigma factor [Phenylobacterium hankyongense]